MQFCFHVRLCDIQALALFVDLKRSQDHLTVSKGREYVYIYFLKMVRRVSLLPADTCSTPQLFSSALRHPQ